MSISLFRTVALRRTPTATAAPLSFASRSISTTPALRSAVKPGSESEANTPGSGSTEEIANSEGAYDGSRTSPQSSSSKIESETSADMSSSSADASTSAAPTKSTHQSDRRPSKQQQSTPDKSNFGATEARKQGGRGSSKSQ
ncbi:hypothetical protein PHBOTO_003419 [Pseudozyma hubeiensis]|nr:hypothetical protein PHBOTO_003419 [Pseudozyma hubeiensis]